MNSVCIDVSVQDFSMTAEALILCEVLELDVATMETLGPYRRIKVFREAQRNMKKWPMLDNVQRVEVNSDMVGLQYHEADINPRGEYIPIFVRDDESVRGVHYEWVYAEEESRLASASTVFQPLNRYLALIEQGDPDTSSNDRQGSNDEGSSGMDNNYGRSKFGIDTSADGQTALASECNHQQASEHIQEHDALPDVFNGGYLVYHCFEQGGEPQKYPVFFPQNRVMFFPYPHQHYDLDQCKVVVNGIDATTVSTTISDDKYVKDDNDGLALGNWEMDVEFERLDTMDDVFDEWKALSEEQRKERRKANPIL